MAGRIGVGRETMTRFALFACWVVALSGCAGTVEPVQPVMTEPFGAPGPREEYHIRLEEVDEQLVAQADYTAAAFRLRVIRNDLENDTRAPGEAWRDDFRARSLFWSGWCLQRCDRPLDAAADYSELLRTYPASRWSRRAAQFLRMLPPAPAE